MKLNSLLRLWAPADSSVLGQLRWEAMRVWEVSVFSVTFQPNSCGLASGRAEGLCYLASVSFQSVCWLKESPSPLCLLAWEKCWSISYHASLIGGNEAAESKMNILGSSSPFNLIFQTLGQRVFKETSDLLSATNILTTLGFGKKKLLLFSRRSQTMCDFVGTAHAPNSMLPGFFTCNRSPLHNVQENEQLWEKCTSDTIQSCL